MARELKLLVALLLCLCLFGPIAQGADTAWISIRNEGFRALGAQKFAQAEALFREARAAGVRASANDIGIVDYDIATALFRQGKYGEADPLCRSALTAYTKKWGPESIGVFRALNFLGLNSGKLGKYAEAEQVLRQALDIHDKVAPDKPLEQVSCMLDLADVLKGSGKYQEAIVLAEKCTARVKESHPVDDNLLIKSLNNLASIHEKRGEYSKATPLFEQCLETSVRANGECSWQTSTILGNLALNYYYVGRYSDCGPLYQRILEIEQKLYGGKNPTIAVTFNNLGLLNLSLGKYKEAEQSLSEAISISDRAFGKAPNTCLYITNLGRVYLESGRLDVAEKTLAQSVQLFEQTQGSDSVDLIWPLYRSGYCAYLQGDYKKAAALFDRAIAIARVKWQPEHSEWANLRSGLALVKAKETAKTNPNINWTEALGRTNTKNITNTPIRDKWALVIGVSKYGAIKGANNFAQNGAEMFYNYLTQNAGFRADHVLLLTDAQATRENIMAAMGDNFLPRNAKPDDLVVIYIATHGSPSDYDVGHLNYLIAYNTVMNAPYATAIPLQYISRTVSERIPAKRAVIVVESCHSGAAAKNPRGFDAAEMAQGTGQIVLTSSRPDQQSLAWQSISPIFTYSLIQGLKSKGNETTLEEGFAYAATAVPQYVSRFRSTQTPMMVCGWPGEKLKLAKP